MAAAGTSPGRKAAKKAAGRGGSDLAALSKEELYERAKRLDIAGRSGMSKRQLIAALQKTG
jgi:hypothetical protein